MKDKDKAQDLTDEVKRLRGRVSELEIADAERKRAEVEVQRQEKRFQAIAENSSDVIILIDAKGTVLYESPAMEQLLGLNPKDRMGVSVFERVHPEDMPAVTERFRRLSQNPDAPVQRVELRLRHKDGSWRTVEAAGSAFAHGSVVEGMVINLRDITDRKTAEENLRKTEERFQSLIESSLDVTVVLDVQGNIIYLSPNFENVWGRKAAGVLGRDMFKDIHPDDIPLIGDGFVRLLKNPRDSVQMQVRVTRIDGALRTLDAVAHNRLENPAVRGIVVNFRDVTERRNAEQALRESEERYRMFAENASDALWIMDMNLNLTYHSGGDRIFGYTVEEMLKRPVDQRMTPESVQTAFKILQEELAIEQLPNKDLNRKRVVEVVQYHKCGSIIHTEETVSFLHDENGKAIGITGVTRDITERKLAEEALKQSEEKLRILFETVGVGITVTDITGKIIDVNKALLDLSGFSSKEEVIGRGGLEFVSEKDRDKVVQALADAQAKGITYPTEITLLRKDGSEYLCDTSTDVIYDTTGNPAGLVVVQRDITERRRAEGALRDAFKQWQTTFDATSDAVCLLDADQRILRCNRAMIEMFNVTQAEIIGRHCWEIVHGTTEPILGCPITRIKDSLHREEMEMQRGDRWFNVTADPILDENNNILGVVHVVRDITASKKAEEELQRKEHYFRSLIENSSDGIMVLNKDGTIRYESPSNLRLLGYTAEERIGRNVFDPILPEDVQQASGAFAQVLSGAMVRRELRARHKGGSLLTLEVTATNLSDDPAVNGIVVNLRDITERRQAEKALRESEEKYSTLVENAIECVTINRDEDKRILFANKRMSEVSGYSIEELLRMTVLDLIPPDFFPVLQERFRMRVEGKEIPDILETRLLCKDGTIKELETSTRLIEYRGSPSVISITRDITERRKAEEALRESEEKYSTLVENATDGVTIIQDKVIKFANKRMSEMSGYTVEELTGMPTFDLVPPDFRPIVAERFAGRARGEELSNVFETKMLCKDGMVKEMESSIKLIQYRGSQAVISITRDITERKRMEEKLSREEQRFRALAEQSSDIIVIVNREGAITYENPAIERVLGLKAEERIGASVFERIHPDDLKLVADAFNTLAGNTKAPAQRSEFRLRHMDGSWHMFEAIGTNLVKDNVFEAIIINLRDITERRKAEEALRESEEKYRLLADNASDVIMLMDMNAKPVYFSPSITRLLGYSVDESMTGSMEGRVTPASMEKAAKHFLAGLDREKRHPGSSFGQTLELEMIHKNGSIVIAEMMVSFIRDASGKPTGIMGILRDITGRKKAEKEIVELSNAFRATLDPVLILDMEGKVENVNDAARRLFERDDVGVGALEAVASEDKERVAALLQDLIVNGMPAVAQFSIITQSGRRVPVESSGNLMLDASGKPVGIVVVGRDLTERKQAEGRQKLAAEILGILNEPLALPDAINRILTAIKRETGLYAVGIRLKKGDDFPYFVQNGFSEDFLQTENTLLARDRHGDICRDENGNISLECTCGLVLSGKTDPANPLFTTGGSAWTNDSIPLLDIPLEQDPRLHPRNRCIHAGFQSVALMPIRIGNKIIGLLQLNDRRKGCFTSEMIHFFEGIAASIGVALIRKQTEDALRESEKKMRALFEVSPDIIMSIDRQGKILFVNRATTRTIEEAIGTPVYDYIPSEYQSLYAETIENVFRTGKPDRIETRGVGPEKRMSWYEARFVLLESGGEQQTLMVVATDITERKRAEEALKESEEKFRTAFDSANTGMCLVDLSGNLIKVNDKMSEIFGYSVEELERMTVNDIAHPEDRDVSPRFMTKALDGEIEGSTFEKRYLSKEGKMVWGLVSSALLHDADGDPLYFISQVQDITERKRAEEALRLSEEKHRMVADLSQDIICTLDMNGVTTYASPAVEGILWYKPDEIVGRNVFDFVSARSKQVIVDQFMKITEEGRNLNNIEVEEIRKDGSPVFIEYNNSFIKDGDKTIGVLAIGRDITERKRMEDALKASEIKYRDLFEHTLLGMEVIDGQTGKVVFSNHSIARMFGFKSPKDMVGTNPMDYVPPEDQEWVISQLAQVMADPEKHDVATLRAKTEDGRIIWVTGSATSFEYEGKPAALMSLIEVTAAKEAQDKLKESEERIKSIVSTSQEWIWAIDSKGRHTFSNPAIEDILGYRPDEIIGQDELKLLHEDDAAMVSQVLSRSSDLKVGWSGLILRWRHKDGSYRYLESNAVPILDSAGVPSGFQGTDRDITERKRFEETLLRVSKAVEGSSDAIGMSDAQGHHFYHNKAFTELFEYTPEELEAAGGGPAAFANRNVGRKVFDTIMGGGSWSGEVEMVSKSGRKFTVLERADAIKDESGKVIGLVGVHTDITERKKAEEKLRETRDYMENLIEHANVPMVVWTPNFRITRFNRAFERLTGMKAKSVIGKDLEILFPKESRDRSMSYIRTAMKGARWEVVEIPIASMKGDVRTVLWNISPIYAEDGKTPMAIIAQGQDITERKQAEEALKESEELARGMLDNAAMGIYLLQNKKFLYVNPTFEKIMGYTSAELVGQEAINYVHPGDRGIIRINAVENLKGVSTVPYEFRALRKDGKQIWVMERVTSIKYKGKRAVIASFMETTEHRKAEEQLERAYEELKTAHDRMVQTEKLRAMGEMASGIAHDFNNMLAVILGRTQLVIDDVKDDKVKKGIQIIEQAALDAAKTVKRLQDFARIRVEHPFESLDVNEVVEGVLKMVESRRVELEQTKGIAIKVEQELEKVGQVSGDAAELREALLNILFNAMDAMPTGGKLAVKSLQDEGWVQISIKDTGVGIPDKVKSRVFEPFFTTKASKGSGLGLSVTYGIIARHGGMIKFDSTVGKGTTFYIRLPLATEAVKQEAKKRKAVATKLANILTVDDEVEVLKALGLTLEYFGHWVKGFTSGAEAIKAFKDGNYDLVITDLGMPGMSGWDVARAIKKIKPDMPVLLITGWVIDLDEEQKKLVDGVIAKPFSRDSISSSISQVFPAKKKGTKKKPSVKKKSE